MTIEAEQEQDALTILEDEREIAGVANLLAVIHGDGGHYAMAHGWGRAIRDAEAIVVALRKERDDLSEYLNDALRVLGEVSASAGIPTDAMFEDPTVITRRMR